MIKQELMLRLIVSNTHTLKHRTLKREARVSVPRQETTSLLNCLQIPALAHLIAKPHLFCHIDARLATCRPMKLEQSPQQDCC